MLYEVITSRAKAKAVSAKNRKVPRHRRCGAMPSFPVITSYSIHYTKLYDPIRVLVDIIGKEWVSMVAKFDCRIEDQRFGPSLPHSYECPFFFCRSEQKLRP